MSTISERTGKTYNVQIGVQFQVSSSMPCRWLFQSYVDAVLLAARAFADSLGPLLPDQEHLTPLQPFVEVIEAAGGEFE